MTWRNVLTETPKISTKAQNDPLVELAAYIDFVGLNRRREYNSTHVVERILEFWSPLPNISSK
jgi:hypothetical protein